MKIIKAIYEWFLNQLLRTPFKWLYLTLSHGFFHLVLLFVIGVLAWHFYKNNQDKLKDTVKHTIWVRTMAPATEPDQWGNKINYYMEKCFINLVLNSDSVENRTNGQYRDALNIWIMPPTKTENGECFSICGDTIPIRLLRQPYNSDIMIKQSDNLELPGNKDIPEPEIVKDSAGICTIKTTLANEAEIPVIGGYIKGKHLSIYSNDFNVGKSPYYLYEIKFDTPDIEDLDTLTYGYVQYGFSITLDDSWTYDENFGRYSTKQLVIHEIVPKPDYISGNLIYYTEKSLEEISKNDGVKLYAEDLSVSNSNKQDEFLNSVLIGTCLAFMLDIIVQLVLKLRRLHQTRKREKK